MEKKDVVTPPQPKWNTYIGARYVPIFAGTWDKEKNYEPLVIVEYQGNSYTSKTFVPAGVEITNTDYWALTGNYNAQVEYYRQETEAVKNRIDALEPKVSNNTINIMNLKMVAGNYVNALEAGIVAGNQEVRAENSAIINDLMAAHRIVYFPNGDYYFSEGIPFQSPCGIIGENGLYTRLHFPASAIYGIDMVVSTSDYQTVSASYVLQNVTIEGTYTRDILPVGDGVRVRNYNFDIECNRSVDEYVRRGINGGAALEFRQSVINNVYISSFKRGLYIDYLCAVMNFDRLMIVHCLEHGMLCWGSDMHFSNMFVTFNFQGIGAGASNLVFDNCYVYVNGYLENENAARSQEAIGFNLFDQYAFNNTLSNVRIEENYGRGLVCTNLSNLTLNGVVVSSNGIHADDNFALGAVFINCKNVVGSLLADNKNATPTQRLGIWCEGCTGFDIEYKEQKQRNTMYQTNNNTFRNVAYKYYNISSLLIPVTSLIQNQSSIQPRIELSQGFLSISAAFKTVGNGSKGQKVYGFQNWAPLHYGYTPQLSFVAIRHTAKYNPDTQQSEDTYTSCHGYYADDGVYLDAPVKAASDLEEYYTITCSIRYQWESE